MLARLIGAMALVVLGGQTGNAATFSFLGGEGVVVETNAVSDVDLGGLDGLPRKEQTRIGNQTAVVNDNYTNLNNGADIETTSRQRGDSRATLEYKGYWTTDPPKNTYYQGRARMGYAITNTGDPGTLLYQFDISDTVLQLWSGGEREQNPFNFASREGPPKSVGVELRHRVFVDNSQTVSDRKLTFWTFIEDVGEFESRVRFRIDQNGIPASTSPIEQAPAPGEQPETIGWTATVDRQFTASIGTFEAGETKDVIVQMDMTVLHGTESDVDLVYKDPGTFSGRFSFVDAPPSGGTFPPVIPLPAAGWMLLSGLAALGVARHGVRRRRG
jgi:hypothetical protein